MIYCIIIIAAYCNHVMVVVSVDHTGPRHVIIPLYTLRSNVVIHSVCIFVCVFVCNIYTLGHINYTHAKINRIRFDGKTYICVHFNHTHSQSRAWCDIFLSSPVFVGVGRPFPSIIYLICPDG